MSGSSPSAFSSAIDVPVMTRAAAFASGMPSAFDTNGTVRLARGFASMTCSTPALIANCTFSSPRTPTPSAIASVAMRTRSISERPSETGGSVHAESPEWMPASSMCSMTPPMYSSAPSYSASTSISIASSRKRSTSSGIPGPTMTSPAVRTK